VAVINEAMARRYFGTEVPLGKRFYFASKPEARFEVVGVAEDIKYYDSLRRQSPPTFYLAAFGYSRQELTVAVRCRHDFFVGAGTSLRFQNIVNQVFAGARILNLKTMDDVVEASVHAERVIAQLGGFFSLFALVLACLGLYGMLSFTVLRRTQEIGLRMALGARHGDVLSLVISQGISLAVTGIVIGICGALAFTRLLSTFLFGVGPTDPLTLIGVSVLLVFVAVLASWVPARRAAKVDPMVALRYE
jgi:hypothetical protein